MTKKQITYSEAIAEIEDIMAKIERNELGIDQLTDSIKRVSTLVRFCKAKLYETEEEVNNLLSELE